MNKFYKSCLLLSFVLFASTTISVKAASEKEVEALKAMYAEMGGDSWTNEDWSEWKNCANDDNCTDPCDDNWLGITCDDLGNIIKVNLDDKNLINGIPVEIGDLENLEILSLGYNQITTIPVEIGNLKNLENLDLRYNQITTIPAKIGDLENLETCRNRKFGKFEIFKFRK